MPRTAILEWEEREYDHNPKSADWYWVLGIIATASIVASILFGNYLFAVLIGIATIVLALHATKQPPLHRFRLVEDGIMIGENLHAFSSMLSFSVLEDIEGELPPILSVKISSWLSPHLMIPLRAEDADMIYEYFLQHVDEQHHKPALSDLVARWFGF